MFVSTQTLLTQEVQVPPASFTLPYKPATASYLYSKRNIYYFRYAFSESNKMLLQRTEIRISLRTSYRRRAKTLALILFAELSGILTGGEMLTYQEIRRRLNILLQRMLEQDAQRFSPRKIVLADLGFPAPDNDEHFDVDLTPASLHSLMQLRYKKEYGSKASFSHLADKSLPFLIEQGFFTANEINEENKALIGKALAEVEISYQDLLKKKEQGDFLADNAIVLPDFGSLPSATPTLKSLDNKPSQPSSLLFSKLIEKYVATKLSDGAWKEHSVAEHKSRLSTALEVLGDKPIDQINREELRELREILRKLPPNRKKSKCYQNKTIAEILQMKPTQVLNVKTVNTILESTASMFDWCIREGYLQNNPAKALQIKDNRQDIELRDAFSLSDVTKLFSSPKYRDDAFKHASFFWAPLIALYTGMRLEEICQLHCADIYESETTGLWVFDINAKPSKNGTVDKLLKSKNAQRIIPMHNDLIKIGLVEYRNRISQHGEERLFPELNKTEASPKYGKQPGKSFSRLVPQLGLEGKKSFHSLRHSFSDFFKTRGLHNDAFRQVFGHEIKELAGRQYGSKFSAAKCYDDLICKLEFEINCEALCKSRFAKGQELAGSYEK